MRIGLGKDLHILESGRPLMIGGIEIPSDKGEKAHSDGDVLIHAIADAIFGALSLEDIGEIFPDTDASLEGLDSKIIAKKAGKLAEGRIENIDAVITLEKPKLSPYKMEIRKSLASLLQIDIERINIKAKTAEGLGPIGKGEAIEAEAVVLLN